MWQNVKSRPNGIGKTLTIRRPYIPIKTASFIMENKRSIVFKTFNIKNPTGFGAGLFSSVIQFKILDCSKTIKRVEAFTHCRSIER